MRWQPWEDYKHMAPVLLPITEPPCKACVSFRPCLTTDEWGKADGIVCCVKKEMENDFSCFHEAQDVKMEPERNSPPRGRCGDCRHYEWDGNLLYFGLCHRLIHSSDPGAIERVSDWQGDQKHVLTGFGFGCIAWEARR